MNLKPHYTMKRIGSNFMIVTADNNDINLTNVYNLNATSAFLWNKAKQGEFSIESLTEAICDEYDTTADIARGDVQRIIDQWIKAGFIIP